MAGTRRAVNEGREAEWSAVFQTMANRTRLSILLQLMQGEQYVTDIAKALKTDSSRICSHLATLRYAGLVVSKRRAQGFVYWINPKFLKKSGDARVLDLEGCVLTFPKGQLSE